MRGQCRYKCRMLQITENLHLCPHAAAGSAAWKAGAVEEARRLLERAGGYAAVLARVEEEEKQRADERKAQREAARPTVRYE